MKSLQEIRIDVVRQGQEIKVSDSFEFQFKKLCEYIEKEFGIQDLSIPENDLTLINNNNFEADIIKYTICRAFGIRMSDNNPWSNTFRITKEIEDSGYQGSSADKQMVYYNIELAGTVKYTIYNLLTISDDQIEFLQSFKKRYPVLLEQLEKIKSNCFPITISE